ncbi:MAG: ribonuclease P protein component [Gemmataceae bacterium]
MKLKTPGEFRVVLACRKKMNFGGVTFFFCPNSRDINRLGVSVGKRHGNSVRRNYLKRIFRESFRISQEWWKKGFDLVCIPSPRQDFVFADALYAIEQAGLKLGQFHSGAGGSSEIVQ